MSKHQALFIKQPIEEAYSLDQIRFLDSPASSTYFNEGGIDMGDKGSKDKGKKEQRKKAQHTLKEKRKLKNEKKKNVSVPTI